MTSLKTIIVTGANRGIGRAICELILSKPDLPPVKLLATTRKGENLGFQTRDDGTQQVLYPKLDISSGDSIRNLADSVRKDGPVDVLINNAGIYLEAKNAVQTARTTLDVNYRGTLEMCQTFVPLLAPQGRIVNLSSVASTLKPYSEQVRQRFRDADMTLQDLEQLAQEYERSVSTQSEQLHGFAGADRSYAFSKSCVNALTRILAQEYRPGCVINACCPGWVNTDMGIQIGRAPKTPEEGARIPVRLAFGDLGGVTGAYWANASVRSRDEGEVQEW